MNGDAQLASEGLVQIRLMFPTLGVAISDDLPPWCFRSIARSRMCMSCFRLS